MPSYTAQRRSGLGGRIGLFRAEIRSSSGEVVRVATVELAERLAELLSGAENGKLPSSAPARHPYRRFQLMHSPDSLTTRVAVVYAGKVTSVAVAVTARDELAERIADVLNRIDFPVDEGRWGLLPTIGKDGNNAAQLFAMVVGVSLGAVLLLILAALWSVAVLGVVLAGLGLASVAVGLMRVRPSLRRTGAPGGGWHGAHLIVSGVLVVVAGIAVIAAFGV